MRKLYVDFFEKNNFEIAFLYTVNKEFFYWSITYIYIHVLEAVSEYAYSYPMLELTFLSVFSSVAISVFVNKSVLIQLVFANFSITIDIIKGK